MNRTTYTYKIIRYMHDPVSGEVLNVAAVLLGSNGHFEFRVPSSLLRVKRAFPGANLSGLRNSLAAVEYNFRSHLITCPAAGLEEILNNALRFDQASFRCSELGAGVSSDLNKAADDLLERFILRCDIEFDEIETLTAPQERWRRTATVPIKTASNDDWSDEPLLVCAR
ncbi:DUF3037 domain-containing protein [Thermomonas brevis]